MERGRGDALKKFTQKLNRSFRRKSTSLPRKMNNPALDCSRCKRLTIALRSQIEKNEELQAMLKNMAAQLELGNKEAKDALADFTQTEKNENASIFSNTTGNDVAPDDQSTVRTAPTQQSGAATPTTPASANTTVDIPINSINGSSVVAASTPYGVVNAPAPKPQRSIIRATEPPVPKPRSVGVSFDDEITGRLNRGTPSYPRNRRAAFHVPANAPDLLTQNDSSEVTKMAGTIDSQLDQSMETPKLATERRPKYMSGNSDDGLLGDVTNQPTHGKKGRLTNDSEILVLPKRKVRPVPAPMITKRKAVAPKQNTIPETPPPAATTRPKRSAAPKSLKEPALNKKMRRAN